MSDTPETDKNTWSDSSEGILYKVVTSDFARRLERERDEARDMVGKLTEQGLDLMDANRMLKRERNQAAAINKICNERDEAMQRRVETVMQCELLMKERDEARAERDILRLDAQREAEHHDRLVKELENLYDKLKS